MKQFSIIKTGYTYSKNSGCTNEFFTCVVINDSKHDVVLFKGMYGAEERVARPLKDAEYTEIYVPAVYGQLKRDDLHKNINTELVAINEVNEIIAKFNQ